MKTYNEFLIERPGYCDTLKVRVYKTKKTMKRDSEKICKVFKYEIKSGDFDAVWTDTPNAKCKYTQGKASPLMFGVMFFNEEKLTTDIIAHECLHSSFSHDYFVTQYKGFYNGDDEERLVCYFQWLLLTILKTLKKAGYKFK